MTEPFARPTSKRRMPQALPGDLCSDCARVSVRESAELVPRELANCAWQPMPALNVRGDASQTSPTDPKREVAMSQDNRTTSERSHPRPSALGRKPPAEGPRQSDRLVLTAAASPHLPGLSEPPRYCAVG